MWKSGIYLSEVGLQCLDTFFDGFQTGGGDIYEGKQSIWITLFNRLAKNFIKFVTTIPKNVKNIFYLCKVSADIGCDITY